MTARPPSDSSVSALEIAIPTDPTDELTVHHGGFFARSAWTPPALSTASGTDDWVFDGRESEPFTLAGTGGSLTRDTFVAPGLELTREVWVADAEPAVAVRDRLTNRGPEPVEIDAMYPLVCPDAESLRLDTEAGTERWDALLQRRYKNDTPQPQSFPADAGEHTAEQFALFRPDGTDAAASLLVGSPDWRDHFVQIEMDVEATEAGGPVESLTATCQFDGVRLPPAGERTSRWIELRLGDDPYDLVDGFADRVGRHNGVHAPTDAPPTVQCSWYFHRENYTQTQLTEDLEALEDDRIPFDVFLIDHCWNVGEFGDFTTVDTWDRGMRDAADRIRAHGYTPGIWVAPYLADPGTDLVASHPEWLATDHAGERLVFHMTDMDHWVLDPTVPGVCDYLEHQFRRIAEEWGYAYCKLDFMRAVFRDADVEYHDPTMPRFEAYRAGLEAIRRGLGPDTYLSVCGGHFEGSLGLADSQRSGSDVGPEWIERKKLRPYRQNVYRNWMNRLWHTDADATMLRTREQPYFEAVPDLSHGKLSDAEARTDALNQYLCGGIMTFTEYFPELGERRSLYRHIIPAVFNPPRPLDPFSSPAASVQTQWVEPRCETLDPWRTVSVVNYHDDEVLSPSIQLSDEVVDGLAGDAFLVTEFFTGETLGVFERGETVQPAAVEPHASRLYRITTWNGTTPVLAGTDCHFTGGGVEIDRWSVTGAGTVSGSVRTDWKYPVEVRIAYPGTDGRLESVETVVVDPGQRRFGLRHGTGPA